jgi:hypothetical protein
MVRLGIPTPLGWGGCQLNPAQSMPFAPLYRALAL